MFMESESPNKADNAENLIKFIVLFRGYLLFDW